MSDHSYDDCMSDHSYDDCMSDRSYDDCMSDCSALAMECDGYTAGLVLSSQTGCCPPQQLLPLVAVAARVLARRRRPVDPVASVCRLVGPSPVQSTGQQCCYYWQCQASQ